MTLGAGLRALVRADQCESARQLRRRVRALADLCDAAQAEAASRDDAEAARWWQARGAELSAYAEQLCVAVRELSVL